MKPDITLTEEVDIIGDFHTPHIQAIQMNIPTKKRIARNILAKKAEDILLINSNAFIKTYIFAGLTEIQIEFIAKNAPKDYKVNLLKILGDKEMMKGVFEIVKSMDEDAGDGSTRHQERIKNIIQYISDNRIAFEFNK